MTKAKRVENAAHWEVWYWFLRQGLKLGLPFNEDAYGTWGNRAEIESWGFKKWWDLRGREIAHQSQLIEPEIIERTESTITIRFPLSMPSKQVKAKASTLVAKARGTKRIRKPKQLSAFNYTKIKQIQRFFKIDLDQRYADETLSQKGKRLNERYKRIGKGHAQAIQTFREKADALQRTGNKSAASQYRRRAIALNAYKTAIIDKWDAKLPEDQIELYENKLERWAIQARLILLNVVGGTFPGENWYGNRRNREYKKALTKLGLTSIGSKRHEGGARGRGLAAKKKKLERLKKIGNDSYGRGGENPVADVLWYQSKERQTIHDNNDVPSTARILSFKDRRAADIEEAVNRKNNRKELKKPKRNF